MMVLVVPAGLASQVLVVVSAPDGTHAEVVAALRAKLLASTPTLRLTQIDAAALSPDAVAASRVIVTVGTHAARTTALLAPSQAVVHTLIPTAAYHSLRQPPSGSAGVSAVLLDQPAERKIALLRLALPDWRRVALLGASASDPRVRELAIAARERQLEVREAVVASERELYSALQTVLAEPAVLIATPDAQIFNSLTIQNVLLTAYRNRSPVLGFSAAYIRAGALLSLYSTPAQIGAEAADLALRALGGSPLPPARAPAQFEVALNLNVARSLGIRLDSADALTAELMRLEEGKP